MKEEEKLTRRKFLAAAGGALGLFAVAARMPDSVAHAAAVGPPPFKRNPAEVKRLLGEMDAKGSMYWSVPRKDGEFLNLMVKAVNATRALEIGTSHGSSAIWMGLGLEETGGRLTTIEIDKARYELASKHLAEAGLSQRVTCILGDAHAEVPKLSGPFDFVFLDADKEGQMDYFQKLYPKKLLPGAILAVHNAIHQAGPMRDYLDMIRTHADFDTVTLSLTMEDGFCISYRNRLS